ncbi:DUF761 domain protein [Medicago truncatula]|uniref:DUF761 domain protein n=1 Tax=Medicago truncatula TaxID=3880 RepID=G7JA54_MEDTR|nr:DUF761 domain protein [Medicago truncatula]
MDNQNGFSDSVTNINMKEKLSMDRKKYMMSRIVFLENEEDINMKADTFITNFRKQLKIERQESLQHFHEMTRRGA